MDKKKAPKNNYVEKINGTVYCLDNCICEPTANIVPKAAPEFLAITIVPRFIGCFYELKNVRVCVERWEKREVSGNVNLDYGGCYNHGSRSYSSHYKTDSSCF